MSDRDQRAIAITSYLVERGYAADMIPLIVEFLMTTNRLAIIPRNAIRDEDSDTLFALAGLD